jgi:CRISPR/Cas system CSM-associated protein Csm3 (group 7 of RAMP superfamily)
MTKYKAIVSTELVLLKIIGEQSRVEKFKVKTEIKIDRITEMKYNPGKVVILSSQSKFNLQYLCVCGI